MPGGVTVSDSGLCCSVKHYFFPLNVRKGSPAQGKSPPDDAFLEQETTSLLSVQAFLFSSGQWFLVIYTEMSYIVITFIS